MIAFPLGYHWGEPIIKHAKTESEWDIISRKDVCDLGKSKPHISFDQIKSMRNDLFFPQILFFFSLFLTHLITPPKEGKGKWFFLWLFLFSKKKGIPASLFFLHGAVGNRNSSLFSLFPTKYFFP